MGAVLARAYAEYTNWARTNKIERRVSKFSTALLSKGTLKSCFVLKAKARAICYITDSLYQKCSTDVGNRHKELRASALWAFKEAFTLLKNADIILTSSERARLRTISDCMMSSLHQLASEACSQGSAAWKLLPKSHGLMEIFEYCIATGFNGAFSWCFADEDGVGRIALCCVKLHGSTVRSGNVQAFHRQPSAAFSHAISACSFAVRCASALRCASAFACGAKAVHSSCHALCFVFAWGPIFVSFCNRSLIVGRPAAYAAASIPSW